MNPHATDPAELIEMCQTCGGDGWVWTRPGLLGTPFHEVTCSACGGSGMTAKDDNTRRRKKRQQEKR